MPERTQQLVYVVDDDQGMLDSTVWLFESMGLKALPFTNGQTFLDACDPAAAACVLLDVRMPGMGGLAVQDAMRERGIGLPVIFVSAHADVPIVVRAFRGGAVDFIEKPFSRRDPDSATRAKSGGMETLAEPYPANIFQAHQICWDALRHPVCEFQRV